MATLFNKEFLYVELTEGDYDTDGTYSHGDVVSSRTVRGTVQSATYKEQIPAVTGTRNTGNVDVYSSEQLKCRTRGGNDGGYVKHGSFIYQLVSEQYYPHLKNIDHWKYVGEMVPEEELPEDIQEAFK